MTNRHRSYCFVDFSSKDLGERVLEEYNKRDFMRRQIKIKPGSPVLEEVDSICSHAMVLKVGTNEDILPFMVLQSSGIGRIHP